MLGYNLFDDYKLEDIFGPYLETKGTGVEGLQYSKSVSIA
jgi:hypothetical protein